ncbi:MAG: hypothetical protein P4L61_00145 [Candidatus Pacebacteria bacterium]|nr:hypothetical protein [Candidatus Paceibacterota bacterium]
MDKSASYKYLETHELPSDLYGKVVMAIDRAKVKKVKRALLISRLGMIASVIVFVPASLYLYGSILQTGFMQSFSLIFYDSAAVARYWQDFGAALLEALPVTSFMVCVGLLFAFLVSLWSSERFNKELQPMIV